MMTETHSSANEKGEAQPSHYPQGPLGILGFAQHPSVEFHTAFAPVVKFALMSILVALAAGY